MFGFLLTSVLFFFVSGFGALPITLIWPHYDQSVLLSMISNFSGFIIAFFTIPLVVRLLHGRPTWSVALPRKSFEGRNFLTGFIVCSVVHVSASLILDAFGVMPLLPNESFSGPVLLMALPLALIGIFIQAGSEEMLFRGYYAQCIRRFTRKKLLFIGIPSLLFALPHTSNISQFEGSLWVLVPYLSMGLLFAWAAYRTGSLWMALGIHLSNNYMATVFVGTKGDVLPSAAPFMISLPDLWIVSVVVVAQSIIIALLLEVLLRMQPGKQGTHPAS